MARIDDLLEAALKSLPPKPADTAKQEVKKRYSELVSEKAALALAAELRHRGLRQARPAPPGELDSSGAERRMAGGLGAKKVDVTWATEESGLLFAISVKSINFKDKKTGNFQKNLTNRRGDMAMEAVTLHRRFPYAVLGAFFFLDQAAANDGSARRKSTFENAHARLGLFSGRKNHSDPDEQFEGFYILLLDASPDAVTVRAYRVGEPKSPVSFSDILDDLLQRVALRNPDFYQFDDGKLITL